MRPEIAQRLLDLNATFYQAHAAAFAETRRRPQPGVCEVLKRIKPSASILDLGCGHGLVARDLSQQGHHGEYWGVDSSPHLLELARQTAPQAGFHFHQADLARQDWLEGLGPSYSVVLAFAVLHHIPDRLLRRRLVSDVAGLLQPGARIEVSVWNFLDLERLRARIVPWANLGVSDRDLDPGDYLLDWRHAGSGLRYVHHFTPSELGQMATDAGLAPTPGHYADGENGRLGLYQTWNRPA